MVWARASAEYTCTTVKPQSGYLALVAENLETVVIWEVYSSWAYRVTIA